MLAACLACVLAAAPAGAWWFGPKAESHWREKTIWVDGNPDEWPQEWRGEDLGVSFAFANDTGFLYALFAPRSRSARAQFAGDYEQVLTLWVDPEAGLAQRLRVTLSPPGKAASSSAGVEARVGPVDAHGALEARIPLSLLGWPTPRAVTVGLEASKPAVAPPPLPVRERSRSALLGTAEDSPRAAPPASEPFRRVRTWARVTLARPPG